MNRLLRDGIATIVMAALVVSYLGLLLNGSVGQVGGMTLLGNPPLAQGPRGMAVIGLIIVAVLVLLWGTRIPDAWTWFAAGVGTIAVAIGVVAVATANWVVLAAFIIAIGATWALLTLHDLVPGAGHSHRHGTAHA